MARRAIPLLAVVPLGALVGLGLDAFDLSTAARLGIIAGAAVIVVAVGTPFALLRRRRSCLVPRVGEASAAGWQFKGVFSDYPVAPHHFPSELAGQRSDPALLLPVVRPDMEDLRGSVSRLDHGELERATGRVIVLHVADAGAYRSRLHDVPNDVLLWPGRDTPLRHLVRRRLRRLAAASGRGSDSDVPARPADRVIDHSIVP